MHYRKTKTAVALLALLMLGGCTQETQNRLGRAVQNWTGTNGVLDIYEGGKLVMRFIGIDKLTTALGTTDGKPRNYRYGYGYLDKNFNYKKDPGEKKLYFEISNFSPYVFYENPED
ncbi:hypothetical protein [Hydrogenimonas sp. SS33]|uniref:hypothetical protein n=1 Tax=Hydrogenimonas leucolamina TaxID=2954236 RepID=UPI00336BBE67